MNIAIIGCGLIGQKRAKTLGKSRLVACVDSVHERALALAKQHPGCEALTDWHAVTVHPEVDIIIICTTHATLAEMALEAANAGKHLLIEKPAARFAEELDPVIEAVQKSGVLARVGFNHRYHRAFRKARELVDEGALGELMFIRARYGHGGRIGYDKEWRAQPELSGGGRID